MVRNSQELMEILGLEILLEQHLVKQELNKLLLMFEKYIKGQKKVTAPIDEEVIKELRKTQEHGTRLEKAERTLASQKKIAYKCLKNGRIALSYLRIE